MQQTNTIVMRVPKARIFETAADLEAWPRFLPHYRYIRYYERSPHRNVVKMAARRDGLPISWVSEQIIDRQNCQVRFRHLKAWTKGMEVVWTFEEQPGGVLVTIRHDLHFRIPALAPLADLIIGRFFISPVATRTLTHMKRYLEKK
ncbi:MAG: SRPBCC family protein [Verrucomicrobia bacterium]|nr:SRPBCC family protein [Verrucomicrobiota bacterium]